MFPPGKPGDVWGAPPPTAWGQRCALLLASSILRGHLSSLSLRAAPLLWTPPPASAPPLCPGPRPRTFCAHAGVGVGPVQALSTVLAGCACTLVHVILAQVPGEACSRGGDGNQTPGAQWHHSQVLAGQGRGAGGAREGPPRVLWPGLGKRQTPVSLPRPLSEPNPGVLALLPCPLRGGSAQDGCHGYSRAGLRIRFPARRLGQLICIAGGPGL